MNNIVLYTTHCPKCNVLEKKLDAANIGYRKDDTFDINFLIEKGFMTAPVLQVDLNTFLDFSGAIKWINERGNV